MKNNDFLIENGVLIKYNGTSTKVEIPEGVTAIGYSAFEGCSSLTEINNLEGVTAIGNYAFYGCSRLTKINIPEGVTAIGDGAFEGCSSLTKINIPEGVTTIGDGAFFGCSSLTEINKLEGVTTIADNAFKGCSSLTKINIPEGVTAIGDGAFSGCSSLTKINNLEGVTAIGNYAFYGCSSLTEINNLEGVTAIGNYAFYGCSSLKEINIPEGVTTIGDGAFFGCSSLTEINNLEGVTAIGNYAFQGCSSLTKINIPEGVTAIGYSAFEGCSSLKEINIPEGVTTIGDGAFSGCSSLTKINNLEGVTAIGNYAFQLCSSLTKINIPEGVTTIGDGAFSGCSSLKSITMYNLPWGVDIKFQKPSDLCDLKYLNLDIFKNQYEEELVNLCKVIFDYLKTNEKDSILEVLKSFSNVNFFENLRLLKKMNMSDEEIIHSVIKYKSLMKNSLKDTLVENYKYLLQLNMISDKQLAKLFFNIDFNTDFNIENNIENLLIEILKNNNNVLPKTIDVLLGDIDDAHQLELRDRLTYIQVLCLMDGDNNEKIQQAQTMICKDMIETIEERNRTLLGNVKDGMYVEKIEEAGLTSISIPLYEKLNGLNPNWFGELCKFIESDKNKFEQFLSVLHSTKEETKCTYGNKKSLNYLKNEIVGRIFLSYILLVLEKNKQNIQNANEFKNKHSELKIEFEEIINLAMDNQLFDKRKIDLAIKIMLSIDPYSFDSLRGTTMQNNYALLASNSGYLFDQQDINQIKEEGKVEINQVPNIKHYIEHIANDISIPKLPNEDRKNYLDKVKKCFDLYIKESDPMILLNIGRAVDFYLRASHIYLMQNENEWTNTTKELFDKIPEEFENLQLYIMQESSRLGHGASEINYCSSTKNGDRMLNKELKTAKNERVKEILTSYHKLNDKGLSKEFINIFLSNPNLPISRLLLGDKEEELEEIQATLKNLTLKYELTKDDVKEIRDKFKVIKNSDESIINQANLYLDEYTLFFGIKSEMAKELIEKISVQLEPPTVDTFIKMKPEEKQDFFARNGYIAEIQKDEHGNPVLVCYSKFYSTPFSIHLADNPFNIGDNLTNINPTLGHYAIGYDCLTLRSSNYKDELESIISNSNFSSERVAPGFYSKREAANIKQAIDATNYAFYDKYALEKSKSR